MKKVLATLVLILVASTVSAAEVKIGAWGRGFFVPYFNDGASDAKTQDNVSWGGGNPRVGMTITGTSDNVGFQVDFNGDGGAIGAGDQQKIWVKPIDMVTVSIGRVYDDTLRGNGDFGSWNWLRLGTSGEDFTFARVSTHDSGVARGGQGAVFAVDPMKELHAFVAFKSLTAGTLMENAMKDIQVGAGYTIGNVGMFRAQYIGNVTPEVAEVPAAGATPAVPKVDAIDRSAINAAFKLTMIQNLYADLGFYYAMDDEAAGYAMRLPVYVKYTMGAIGIHALFQLSTGQKDTEAKDATGIEAGLGLDYAIGDGLGAVVDFRYLSESAAGIKDGNIGGMVGIEKGFSNGKIGAGVEFATASIPSMPETNDGTKIATEEMSIAIPVKVEYWF